MGRLRAPGQFVRGCRAYSSGSSRVRMPLKEGRGSLAGYPSSGKELFPLPKGAARHVADFTQLPEDVTVSRCRSREAEWYIPMSQRSLYQAESPS